MRLIHAYCRGKWKTIDLFNVIFRHKQRTAFDDDWIAFNCDECGCTHAEKTIQDHLSLKVYTETAWRHKQAEHIEAEGRQKEEEKKRNEGEESLARLIAYYYNR